MKKNRRNKQNSLKLTTLGFTLIELIVVLVILAIIVIIAVPIVINILDKAEEKSKKRSVDNYARAVEYASASYKMETGIYATDFNQLKIDYSGPKVECDEENINKDGSVYISKCKIDDEYIEDDKTENGYYTYGTYKENYDYKIGDIVKYNSVEYYVIRNIKPNDDTIPVLKVKPLTYDEITKYGEGHVNMYNYYYYNYYTPGDYNSHFRVAYQNGNYGGMAYYTSPNCGYDSTKSNKNFDSSNCTTSYDLSEVKYVVDAWAANYLNETDLVIDSSGYNVRLINEEDLNALGSSKNRDYYSFKTNYKWLNDYLYWTMIANSSNYMYVLTSWGGITSYPVYYGTDSYSGSEYCGVRPVVILKRSGLE